ncbi:hypothetical protein ACUXV3_08290 [Roseobacteraceae bacterium NS-SX3]
MSEEQWLQERRDAVHNRISAGIKRSREGLTISSGPAEGEISLTVKRYREKAEKMQLALARLSSGKEQPDVASQVLGLQPHGDSFVDYVLQNLIRGGGSGVKYSVTYEVADADTGSGHDALSMKGQQIMGVNTGDGSDAVSLEGDRIYDVAADRDRAVRAMIRTDGKAFVAGDVNEYASSDSLSIRGRDVANISAGGGDDAIAIRSRLLEGVRAGDGNDAITVASSYAAQIHGGSGNDSIAVQASLVTGIRGGSGDDRIFVAADQGLFSPHQYDGRTSQGPATVAGRMSLAAQKPVNVEGGTGNDTVHLRVSATLAASGGVGNDRFRIEGGTVALDYLEPEQGHDIVELAEGAEVMLKADIRGGYSVEREGNSMTVRFANGSAVTLHNLTQAAAVGIGTGHPEEAIDMLHLREPLDQRV